MTNSFLTIIQARMGSTRLPGKTLKDINGSPLVKYVIRRANEISDAPILAIPESTDNDEIEERAVGWPCEVVRGSEEDVLRRFYKVVSAYPDRDYVIRISGDNPLLAYELGTPLIDELENEDWAYFLWNALGAGFGTFKREWIVEAHKQTDTAQDREHVTTWIKRQSDIQIKQILVPKELRAPGFRLTVDHQKDLDLIREICRAHPDEDELLPSRDIVQFLREHPEVSQKNRNLRQTLRKDTYEAMYCLNEGKKWGTGHRSRFNKIRSECNQAILSSKKTIRLNIRLLLGTNNPPGLPNSLMLENENQFQTFQTETKYPIDYSSLPLEESKMKKWVRQIPADVVIFDHKQSSEELVTSLKEEGVRVIGIEDRGSGRNYMDAVIDPNLYTDTLSDDQVPREKQYYGPSFAMIDPSFYEHRRSSTPKQLETIGVFFGGSDPTKLGPDFLKPALSLFENGKFHYFGPETLFSEFQRNTELSSDELNRINFRNLVNNPAEAFSKMDLMVISGGIVKFEVACLNLPAVVIPQNEEQHVNAKRFINKNNLAWPLFSPDSEPEEWLDVFTGASEQKLLASWSKNIKDVVDGNGVKRFVNIVEKLVGTQNSDREDF